ncbi:MAG: hypothetical protein JNN04_01795, partial [Cyclobacteriaceae bacterium]|nr:hypothetical protein [Cyclobacteriaceae bacterium]
IVELFKGQLADSIISGEYRTSCSGFAENGRWIIYVESIDKGLIDFNVCGISRSFDRPEWIMVSDYSFPGPLRDRKDPEQSTQEMIDFYKVLAKNKERALFDLESEISMLRKRKQ